MVTFLGVMMLIIFALCILTIYIGKLTIKLALYVLPLFLSMHKFWIGHDNAAAFWLIIQLMIWAYLFQRDNH